MNEDSLEELNKLFHKIHGDNGDIINEILIKEDTSSMTEKYTLELLKRIGKDSSFKLWKILLFYDPWWKASKAIEDSDAKFKIYEQDNMLLLALTSIIDWLANKGKERGGYTKRFIAFIEKNLKRSEIKGLIETCCIMDNTVRKQLKDLKEWGEYIYAVRSRVIHDADLSGMYHYDNDIDIEFGPCTHDYMCIKKIESYRMFRPDLFRNFLWKAILNSLGFKIGWKG